MNYPKHVSVMLTKLVREHGATIEIDMNSISVLGPPASSGAYATFYTVGATGLVRTEKDEYGRVLKRETLRGDGVTWG